jgi:hypothetical protein
MPGAAGYVLIFSETRAQVFDERSTEGPYFAEAVPEFEHSRTSPLVVFLSTEPGAITHIARGKRGMRAGTDQRRLNLEEIRELKRAIPVKRIEETVPANVRYQVARRLTNGALYMGGALSVGVHRELRRFANSGLPT